MRPGVITVVLPVYGVETYLDRSGPVYQWALCVRKGGDKPWDTI